MKPRNFPGRRERRQARASRRLLTNVPRTASYIEQPTDIRIRIGAAGRAA